MVRKPFEAPPLKIELTANRMLREAGLDLDRDAWLDGLHFSRYPKLPKGERISDKPLREGNHVIYMGKYIPPSVRERGEVSKPLYDRAFVEAALDLGFSKMWGDGPLRMAICPDFSEFFNGEEDVKRALATDKHKEMIRAVAARLNREGFRSPCPIDVVDLAELPEHRELFEAFRSGVGEDGFFSPNQAFAQGSSDIVSNESTSYDLAEVLHQVVSTAAKDSRFMEHLKECVPPRHRDRPNSHYYVVGEVAIKLWDVLNGRAIQIGADREWKYDRITKNIIGGHYGEVDLSALFSEESLTTAYIDTERNYHKLAQIRRRARTKIGAILGLIGLVSMGGARGAYYLGQENERQHQLSVDEEREAILGQCGWTVEQFNEASEIVLKELTYRYGIRQVGFSDQQKVMLRQDIEDELIARLRDHAYFSSSGQELADFVDRYVKKKKLFLMGMLGVGASQLERPYPDLWAYRDEAIFTLEQGAIASEARTHDIIYDEGSMIPRFQEIGRLAYGARRIPVDRSTEDSPSLWYVCANFSFELDLPESMWDREVSYYGCSTELGLLAAQEYQRVIRRYDILELERREPIFRAALDQEGDFLSESSRNVGRLFNYTDSFGEFDYEIGMTTPHSFTIDRLMSDPIYVGRRRGEKAWSQEVAREAAQRYFDAYYEWGTEFPVQIEVRESSHSSSSFQTLDVAY
jgi:hypothetical protein